MRFRIIITLFILNLISLCLHGQQLYFHRLTVDDGLPHNTVNAFAQDKNGFMWIASAEGLCRFDGYKIKIYHSGKSPNTPVNNRPAILLQDADGDIWISFFTTTEVCKYNDRKDDFTRYQLNDLPSDLQIRLRSTVGKGNPDPVINKNSTWEVINHQLVQQDNRTGNRYTYTGKTSEEGSLFDSYVLSLYLDNNDVLWVGTENGGVHYADVNRKKFEHYTFEFDHSDFLSDNAVRVICEDDRNNLWVGTRNNGLIRMSPDRSQYAYFDYTPSRKATLQEKRIRQIYQDSKGFIWIGTQYGVFKYDYPTSKTEHYVDKSATAIDDNFVYAIHEDNHGILWMGTWKGMSSYNFQTENFVSYNPDETLVYSSVRSIVPGKGGGLWIATENGLTFMDYEVSGQTAVNIKATYYQHQEGDSHSLNDDFLYVLDVDADGNIWIGTARGLNMYDISQKQFIRFNDIEYLSNTLIRGIVCINDEVWVSHRYGLTRLNRKDLTYRHFDKSDGLQDNEFSEDAYGKNTRTGELFFGGNNGMNTFFPSQIKDNPYPPKIVFTDLKIQNKPVEVRQEINGKVILENPVFRTDHLIFDHTNKEFELEFAALHYSNPTKNRYAYKLEGFDNQWIYTNATRRSVIYSGLAAGKYTLKVKGSNCDGVWNEDPIEMQITILPPWWASGLAYVLYLLLFLSVCVAIVRNIIARKNLKYRIQLEKVKAEKAEEISQLRSTFFTGISHELRSPVTLIIDPLRRLIENKVAPEEMQKTYQLMYRNSQRLLSLINQLLDFRKLESSKQELHLQEGDVILSVKNVLEMFELAAQKKNITLELETPAETHMLVFDAGVLDKVLVNLLSNAIKYSPEDTKVTVKLSVSNLWFTIQVIDQGIGIAPEMKEKIFDLFFRVENSDNSKNIGSGIGLALTRELIYLHKGNITVESEPGVGSTFTVLLPATLVAECEASGSNQTSYKDARILLLETESNKKNELAEEENHISDKPLILVVEDNEDIRNYIKDSLTDNYNVITATNGKQGWEMALEVIPTLIVSDVMMPEMSGFELCEKLKKDEHTSHIPVILLTAHQSDAARIEGYETGADDYISKPFNTQLLRIRIQNLVESREKLRSLFGNTTKMELKKISVNAADEKFINRAVEVVRSHLADLNFTPDLFASEMAVSRAQLFRKIKAMTNQTVQEFIVTIRLNEASELLLTTTYTIGEVAVMTGFSEASNFTRSFTKKFKKTPSAYIKDSN